MNWLQSLRHRYSLSVFQTRANKVAFPHQFVDFDHAQMLGFIVNIGQFNADDLVYFTKYITHLEDKGKKVVVVELNFQRKAEPMFRDSVRSVFINTSQINWLDMPSLSRMKEVNDAKIDILVNLDLSERMTSRYVCGLSNAQTRVGLHEPGYEQYYELMLQLPAETKLNKVLEHFEFYSKMIEK